MDHKPDQRDRLLSNREAAEYLGVSVSALNKWRLWGRGPVFRKAGARVLYRASDLDAWLDSRAHSSTSEYGAGAA